MKIICPSCSSEYDVPDGSIGGAGRKVRCVECKTIWLAAGDAPPVTHEGIVMTAATKDVFAEPEFLTIEHDPPVLEEPGDKVDDNSVELDAWIAIASENQSKTAENDQDSVDSLFDDEPPQSAEPTADAAEPEVLIEPNSETPALPAPTLSAVRPRRGLLNSHIGAFRTKRSRAVPAAVAGGALFVAMLMGIVAFRDRIVSVFPQLAGVYRAVGITVNLRGLEIGKIASQLTEADGIKVLVINAEISNPGPEPRDLPPIFFGILDEAGKQQYGWSVALDERSIAPGATLPFRRRLATPPPEARKVMVRFFVDGDPKPTGSPTPASEQPSMSEPPAMDPAAPKTPLP
jgi:predicted Zn finger-like uncharacterized protein